MDLLNTEAGLNTFMGLFIDELKSNLTSLGKEATGDLINSLSYTISPSSDGYSFDIELIAEPYLDYVDKGRRPGKFPPPTAIKNWIEAKGLNVKNIDSAAYLIGRKIANDGIKPTDVIQISFDTAWDNYKSVLGEEVIKDFEAMIDDINKKINK